MKFCVMRSEVLMKSKTMTPNARKWKRGNVHPQNGLVFWEYNRECKNGELWVSKERLQFLYERAREIHRKWRSRNPGNSKDRSKKWKIENLEKSREYSRKASIRRRKMTPWKVNELNRRRDTRIKNGVSKITDEEKRAIEVVYEARCRISKCTGIAFHVDHISPISKGGKHHPCNLQILPATWNLRKNNNGSFPIPKGIGRHASTINANYSKMA